MSGGSCELRCGRRRPAEGPLLPRFELSTQQRQVVTRLLTAGHGIDAVVGVAGSGKTTLMQAARLAWDATGTTYAGAALSAVAAANLENGSGIPSRTLAAWTKQIADGPGLTGVDVLVVDEAAMADDRQVAAVLTEAARTGTKVVAIGDPQQLRAIGPGGGFAEVHRLVGGEVLAENRRQRHAGERAALQVWRTGAREDALRMLAGPERVHATATADQARTAILAAWDAVRTRWDDVHDQVAEFRFTVRSPAFVCHPRPHADTTRRRGDADGDRIDGGCCVRWERLVIFASVGEIDGFNRHQGARRRQAAGPQGAAHDAQGDGHMPCAEGGVADRDRSSAL